MQMNTNQWSSQARRMAPRGRGRRQHARAGFTLIEIMVALAILMLMMTIIFVPLNLGTRFFHIGNARAHLQQAAQLSLNQIANDLRQAVYVYPNDALAGVTDKSPYNTGDSPLGRPYYQAAPATPPNDQVFNGSTANNIVCDSASQRVGNTSRIDFILPLTPNDVPGPSVTPSSVPYTPTRPAYYLAAYYARRLNVGSTLDPRFAYDAVDNPIMLFRAQCPLYSVDSTGTVTPSINLQGNRYPASGSCSTTDDRTSAWLAQSQYGEPNLEIMATDGKGSASGPDVVGNHLLITPRGMSLLAPHALDDKIDPPSTNTLSYVPETSFVCEDTNGDGKIDRVRINLALGEFDEGGAVTTAQNVRLSEMVDLPNIR